MNKCIRCGIGYDTDGDGNCGICAKWNDTQLLVFKYYGEKMTEKNYNVRVPLESNAPFGSVIRLWNKHVTIEEAALKQLDDVASMPFVKPFVAAMPILHQVSWGIM